MSAFPPIAAVQARQYGLPVQFWKGYWVAHFCFALGVSAKRVWYNSDMDVAADLQRVRSLDAMSLALRASQSTPKSLVEIK
jgi:hypothetical protein